MSNIQDDAKVIADLINLDKLNEAEIIWTEKIENLKVFEAVMLKDKIHKLIKE